jgi:hypothetical protein
VPEAPFMLFLAGAQTSSDLHSAVARRRRESAKVGREGNGVKPAAVAYERREASTLFISHIWLYRNRLRLFVLEKTACQAVGWTRRKTFILDEWGG